MAVPPPKWKAAVCYDSPSVTKILRETLDEMGWKYSRDRTLHHFSRLIVILSIPSNTYVFRFIVMDPVRIVIDVYDEKPTHSGTLHFIEIEGLSVENAPWVRKMLNEMASHLPRKPYQFFMVEKFKTGFLNKDHMRARREWSRWGI